MSAWFVVADDSGEIQGSGYCPAESIGQCDELGKVFVAAPAGTSERVAWVRGADVVLYTAEQLALKARCPSYPSRWSNAEMRWVDLRSDAQRGADDVRRNRATRDKLLADSDWTQLPDSPLTPAARAAWAEYRRALRDVILQSVVAWPASPGNAG